MMLNQKLTQRNFCEENLENLNKKRQEITLLKRVIFYFSKKRRKVLQN